VQSFNDTRGVSIDLTTAALIALAVSTGISAVLAIVILQPTRKVLERLCPTQESVSFWMRFTILMLILGPLIVTLVFAVPSSAVASDLVAADLLVKLFTAALVGAFLTLGAIGLRLGTLRPPPTPPAASRPRTDDERLR
jgi:hypothetical protein